jgi:hypothetical protein
MSAGVTEPSGLVTVRPAPVGAGTYNSGPVYREEVWKTKGGGDSTSFLRSRFPRQFAILSCHNRKVVMFSSSNCHYFAICQPCWHYGTLLGNGISFRYLPDLLWVNAKSNQCSICCETTRARSRILPMSPQATTVPFVLVVSI